MDSFAFAPPPPVLIPIAGTQERFPVRRIYCVGHNYADHVKEMGGDDRHGPFFFKKPTDAIDPSGTFPYPSSSFNVHHEVELMVALGPGLEIFGYGIALDMTRRDLQEAAQGKSRPWESGKSFDHSAPCGPLVRDFDPSTGGIWLDVNGQRRQTGDLRDQIWCVPEILMSLSRLFLLEAGDVILTGTPSGVGPVVRGDQMHAGIEGLGTLDVRVV